MNRRSFLALLTAPVAALLAFAIARRPGSRGVPPAPDYSRITWSNIPIPKPDEWYRVWRTDGATWMNRWDGRKLHRMTVDEYMAKVERNARRL